MPYGEKLSEGGMALMPLGEYPFSEKYGWTQDRYGLSWQVMFGGDRAIKQKIFPTLMFVGDVCGKGRRSDQLLCFGISQRKSWRHPPVQQGRRARQGRNG